MDRYSLIIAAGGSGSRFGSDKLFAEINNGKSVLQQSVETFLNFENITEIIIAVQKTSVDKVSKMFSDERVEVIEGGTNRTESVLKALNKINKNDFVIIHDGARPFVTEVLIDKLLEKKNEVGSFLYTPVTDSILKKNESGFLITDRNEYMAIQTPCCFKRSVINEAYEKNIKHEAQYDDVSLVIKYTGKIPEAVLGDPSNKKVTYREDIEARADLVGVGYDIHRLEEGDGLYLCGVKIDFNKRPVAHSDGDIPIHALMDAMLSAMGKKDIGHYFPVDDSIYDNIASTELLKEVVKIMQNEEKHVANISICIILEKPKLAKYINEMKKTIARIVQVTEEQVGISVTTNEDVGEIGKGDAIASYVSVLLKNNKKCDKESQKQIKKRKNCRNLKIFI